jgi:flagellar protein FliT
MDNMNNTQILAAYKSISQLTSSMADAARGGDWDKLVDLEQRCGVLVATLKNVESAPLALDMQQQKIKLIRKILADDAEVRGLTEPWMGRLQALLCGATREHSVHKAYNIQPRMTP